MPTLFLTHKSCLDHDTGYGHPERADRLRAIYKELENEAFASLIRAEAPKAELEDILRAHPQSLIDEIDEALSQSSDDLIFIDGDTVLCPDSREAIYRAAGAGVEAVHQVMAGQVKNAFCAIRPPGHHAERKRAMGFCFFNNIAIAALYAKQVHGCKRVAIIDFDVHHGNGTQDIFWKDPDVFYGSTHEMPLFPGTGQALETGAGNIFNAPLPPRCESATFRSITQQQILEPLKVFAPEFIFISAGFDAHARDPLATVALLEDDFAWVTKQLLDIAQEKCHGRVVSMLEGGYDLVGLSTSVRAHIQCLMEFS